MLVGFHKALFGLIALTLVVILFAVFWSTQPSIRRTMALEVISKMELNISDYVDAFGTTNLGDFVTYSNLPGKFLSPVDNPDMALKNADASVDDLKREIKIIYQPTGKFFQTEQFNKYFERNFHFEGCTNSNCKFTHSHHLEDTVNADIVLMEFQSGMAKLYRKYGNIEKRLLWFVWSHEPPGLYDWPQSFNKFDGFMAYRTDATVYWPWGWTKLLNQSTISVNTSINYSQNKKKEAFAYVSHCRSNRYDRLETMRKLAKYIEIDIYGKCTGRIPCPRMNFACEKKLHTQYRFVLAFENSLCKDYISEKFWARLASDGHFVPVVVGGKSIEDYNNVAPPDAFIHAYNFSSIQKLGEYLQHLMTDDNAYNRYHEWRKKYTIVPNKIPPESLCKLCSIANNPEKFLSQGHRNLSKT